MRYLLHESQREELAARQAYLYDIFHVYFLPGKPEGRYIPLYPFSSTLPDVLFITGHVNQVYRYLFANIESVQERVIVITSCFGNFFREFAAEKEVYVPDLREGYCHLRNGSPYGFDFKISDAELDFYNAKGDVMERICSAYDRLQ